MDRHPYTISTTNVMSLSDRARLVAIAAAVGSNMNYASDCLSVTIDACELRGPSEPLASAKEHAISCWRVYCYPDCEPEGAAFIGGDFTVIVEKETFKIIDATGGE